ncbi:hypothetical protein D3C75_1325930 [compost metagenome]
MVSERVWMLDAWFRFDPLFQVIVAPELSKHQPSFTWKEIDLEAVTSFVGDERVFPSEKKWVSCFDQPVAR